MATDAPMSPTAGVRGELGRYAVVPPFLLAAVDQERVGSALRASVPELKAGGWILRDCEPKRLRLNMDAWTGQYVLSVATPDGEQQTVTLSAQLRRPDPAAAPPGGGASLFAPDGSIVLPALGLELGTAPADEALTALPLLTDPDASRELLVSGVRSCTPAYAEWAPATCVPRIVRHKPGSRCTIVYDLQYPPGSPTDDRRWPDRVIAKAYRGDKGRNAYEAMRLLWQTDLSTGDVVTLAQPLAYLPEHNVLVQAAIGEEQTFKQLLRSALRAGTDDTFAELCDYTRLTAEGLAAVHASGADHGETVTLDDELAEIRGVVDRLETAVPTLAGAATPLLALVEDLARVHQADPLRPSHGSFRPGQVLLANGRVGFIDFDGFCRAEPARDVALFRTAIRDVGLASWHPEAPVGSQSELRATIAWLDEVCEVFLVRYEQVAPLSRERVMLWETLDLFTNVLNAWTKVKPERVGPTIRLLDDFLVANAMGAS
jgi:aminoglycoside phosphotransferase (APT) family kinase protein